MTPEILASAALAASVAIAPPGDALTFARITSDAGRRVLLVRSYERGEIDAVDLSAALGRAVRDPITVYRELGYDALAGLASDASPDARVRIDSASLTIPVDLGDHHVAAGTNYPEHAGESGVEDGPFLFAKLVVPTGARAEVSAGHGLLDYEVELAWVVLEDLDVNAQPAGMGVILCNDYTDRETLLRRIDVWDVATGKGFTTGKSFPGFLPVGDLFVIPRDYRAFAERRELVLAVNGVERQRAPVSAHVWGIDEILAETWRRREERWDHRGADVALLAEGGALRARTLVMAGTPAGTVFQGIGLRHRASGVVRWIAGGFDGPVAAHVIEAYVADPNVRARYLRPGDRVTIRVDGLGTIENSIIP